MNFIITIAYVVLIPILWISIVRLLWEARVNADEVHYAPTADGYEIALYRYRPSKREKDVEPVILCHGLGSNHTCYTPGPFNSLAKFLADEGFDVFTIDLRGRGLSSKPNSRRGKTLDENWTFDDYVTYDLPAVIKYVRRETRSEKINWVGHSMGGMVIYAYLQQHPDGGGVKCATAISSPGNMTRVKQYKFVSKIAPLFLRGKIFHSRELVRLIAPFSYIVPYEKFGMKRGYVPWIAANCVSNTSTNVMRQFRHWAMNTTFCNNDGSMVYSEGFHKIKTPLMTMVASGDFIAHPADILYVAERLNGVQHRHVFFSKKKGSIGHYDHNSIIMGEPAQKEVFPKVAEWIREHSAG